MSHHSRSSTIDSSESNESNELFLDCIEEALQECPPPHPEVATTEDPVLASKRIAAAIQLQNEDLRHLLHDAQAKAPGDEKAPTSAAGTSPSQGNVMDKLNAEIEQLSNTLKAARADLAAAQWQLREAGRVQTQAPNTFEATMTEVIEAVDSKWQDYNSLASVADPAKEIKHLRQRNKELEEENKNLDRKGFIPKRMRDLVNKVNALRERNSELTDKLKRNERSKADVDRIAELEAEISKITLEKADLFKKQKSIFHLCKELNENQGHKGDLSEYKMNDMVFEMFGEFIKQKIAQYK
ncbi:hypothetical protein PpBr36_04960 [Pyricularia pennisetigena]|uniref:hypothetical protein n=1 Tax=Pyricularia pennisetigena TaxID=1578925 RepID=UPI00114D9B3D|nr:hypothetical protein PpBr36_04960 [Pyricularia pennisetigena]TLS27127.1 hypothetical protein PpBr36_04960 [Pyricularia pennisetigena]